VLRDVGSLPNINPLNAKINLICHLLALLVAHHIPHVSRIRVKLSGKLRRMSWAGRMMHWGIGEAHTGFCWGKLKDDTAWKTT